MSGRDIGFPQAATTVTPHEYKVETLHRNTDDPTIQYEMAGSPLPVLTTEVKVNCATDLLISWRYVVTILNEFVSVF